MALALMNSQELWLTAAHDLYKIKHVSITVWSGESRMRRHPELKSSLHLLAVGEVRGWAEGKF